ncbi:MAG: VWA domain-containing protein [Deltaproteobacteria bacterium]|nr:VWA domain-containing protein [Deltaproteobacteria bacterium]
MKAEAPARPYRSSADRGARSADDASSARGMSAPPPGVSAPVFTRPRPPVLPRPRTRLLTAASVGDADRYHNYLNYLSRHARERNVTGLQTNRRLRIRVLDTAGRPINNAKIQVQVAQGQEIVGHSHADGRWAFFPSLVNAPSGSATLSVSAGQRTVRARVSLPHQGDAQQLTVRLPVNAIRPKALDLAFVIDVTGSMSDELRYVNGEIADITRRIRLAVPNTDIRVSGVFYRDRSDARPLEILRFTRDVRGFGRAMTRIRASGGGDYPEDMAAGLHLAMRSLDWRRGNVVRAMILIADAPPKRYRDASYSCRHALLEASQRGIRILPVAASGANRTVEYLFRAMGVATSTPYVYLTDDSGVGNAHMEADTDRVGVERFNDLLTRLVVSDLRGQGMHEPGQLGPR